jgi:Fe-S cluster biogenesis protein NfuA
MSDIFIQPTPNPNALKFVIDTNVKSSGKSSYKSIEDTKFNPLAEKIFKLRGVDQLHFFMNVITVSKFNFADWDELEEEIIKVINDNIEEHDPNFKEHDPEIERRANLPPEVQKIEAILDSQIRPGLQGDGGDLSVVDYQDNILIIKYQGACGTCPSSTAGTLNAITSILRDEFNPEIEVYTAPDYD